MTAKATTNTAKFVATICGLNAVLWTANTNTEKVLATICERVAVLVTASTKHCNVLGNYLRVP